VPATTSKANATRERLHRLVGTGFDESGGGLPLPLLFAAILNRLQDAGSSSTEQLSAVVKHALNGKEARVLEIYKLIPGDPWQLLTKDALDQLASRQIVGLDEEGWSLGPAFRTSKPLIVVPAREGKKASRALTITVWSAVERQSLATHEHLLAEVRALTHSLNDVGLRPLSSERVEELARSMDAFGYLTGFPILVDQHGRVLSGRHRLAAAKSRGIEADVSKVTVHVSSDEEALAYVWLGNSTLAWSDADRKRLGRRLLANGPLTADEVRKLLSPAAKREQIKAELRKNSDRSTNDVASVLGCDYQIVAAVRAELEALGVISPARSGGDRGGKVRAATSLSRGKAVERVRMLSDREGRDERVLRRVEAGEPAAHAAVAEGYSSQRATEAVLRARLVRAERALAELRETTN
jgi:hypothetical protein